MGESGFCTCDDEIKADEDLEVLPPESEEKQEDEEEEELLEEEEEVETDDEEELPEEEEEKDAGKLVSLLEEALSYLKDKPSAEAVAASMDAVIEEEKQDELKEAVKTLKKNGISIYAGRKRTPATKPAIPKAPKIDYLNFSKSLDEIERMADRAGGN
tara:strand:+ start:779 stop:1252 length:474 start_codon:yes stop_codon:yes gene_type:complete